MIRKVLPMMLTFTLAAIAVSAQGKWGQTKSTRTGQSNVRQSSQSATNSSKEDHDSDDKVRLEGTWRATETFPDESVFRILFSFAAGKNANNGVVTHSDELFLVASPSCLSAQGVWKRTDDRKFIATDEGFCFDTFNGFAPAGKIQFRSAIQLNRAGNEFNGIMHIDGFDLEGNIVFSADATLHGERMRAEGP